MELRTQRNKRQRDEKTPNGWLSAINLILFAIALGITLLIVYDILRYRILAINYYNVALITALAVIMIVLLFFNLTRRAKKTTFFISLVYTAILGFGVWRLQEVIDLFSRFSQTQYNEYTMSVVVLKDSAIQSVKDIQAAVDAPTLLDQKGIQELVEDIKQNEQITLETNEVSSYSQAYTNLVNGKVQAIVLNSAYESLIYTQDLDYASKIKKIYEFKVKKEKEKPRIATNQKIDKFNIYISGIDTFGEMDEVSRSDVNMIMSVNTQTHQVLLTSTPRDTYLRIAGGGNNEYDKLTHAGIYGIESSIQSLENLYDIKIDYHVRLNFTAFIKLIDILGGVDIENEYAFTNIDGFFYPEGQLHLDAQKALAYVRERKNLVDGDIGRARNQQKVIKAILQKMLSPTILTNTTDIVNQISDSVQTTISFDTIIALANKQLEKNEPYTVDSQALITEGVMGLPSYAAPGEYLYMGVIDDESLTLVKQNLSNVMEGKAIQKPDTESSQESETTVQQ